MDHGKVDVEKPDLHHQFGSAVRFGKLIEYTYQFWVSLKDLLDIFPGESLLPEPSLDVVQDLRVIGIRFVQQVPERQIGRP